ncbi:UNVERIFIED_CONTAM: hypothetical protein RMT77_008540 [Armadillidium vulgare]
MSKTKYTRNLIDSIRLYVKAGSGGNGHPKFGGIGGKGGDVYVEGVKNQKLEKLKKSRGEKNQWVAESGKASQNHRIYGVRGKDLVIPAPLGTMVQTDYGLTLGDILQEGEQIMVARGGAGGNPDNNFFGQPGEKRHVQLLLKLIADIGLVGFPNAGKSTLLRAISHARPKVASYPFTTLEPTVGMLKFDDSRVISMADLPGLIEGAWINKGMGHKFLRHVERTKLMLFVVDVEGFQLGPTYPRRSPIETVILLNKEIELYQPELVEKPAALVFNKMDKINSKKELDALKDQLLNMKEIAKSMSEENQPEKFISFSKVIGCSAKHDRKSVEQLKQDLRGILDIFESENQESLPEIYEKIKDQMYEKNLKLL